MVADRAGGTLKKEAPTSDGNNGFLNSRSIEGGQLWGIFAHPPHGPPLAAERRFLTFATSPRDRRFDPIVRLAMAAAARRGLRAHGTQQGG